MPARNSRQDPQEGPRRRARFPWSEVALALAVVSFLFISTDNKTNNHCLYALVISTLGAALGGVGFSSTRQRNRVAAVLGLGGNLAIMLFSVSYL